MRKMRVDNIPLELKAILGQVQLKLSQLNVGDVIILNQKIDEPIKVEITKQKSILAFPCALNNKKAIKIKKL